MGSISIGSSDATDVKFDWQKAIQRKQEEIKSKTPKQWMLSKDFVQALNCGASKQANLLEFDAARRSGILTERELEVTERYTAMQLLDKLRKKKFTALEVTTAFCKRTAIAQQLVSLVSRYLLRSTNQWLHSCPARLK